MYARRRRRRSRNWNYYHWVIFKKQQPPKRQLPVQPATEWLGEDENETTDTNTNTQCSEEHFDVMIHEFSFSWMNQRKNSHRSLHLRQYKWSGWYNWVTHNLVQNVSSCLNPQCLLLPIHTHSTCQNIQCMIQIRHILKGRIMKVHFKQLRLVHNGGYSMCQVCWEAVWTFVLW